MLVQGGPMQLWSRHQDWMTEVFSSLLSDHDDCPAGRPAAGTPKAKPVLGMHGLSSSQEHTEIVKLAQELQEKLVEQWGPSHQAWDLLASPVLAIEGESSLLWHMHHLGWLAGVCKGC